VLPTVTDASVDLVLTDPPYGHNNNNGDLAHRWEEALGLVKRGVATAGEARPIANDGPEANEMVRWMFGHAARVIKPGRSARCDCHRRTGDGRDSRSGPHGPSCGPGVRASSSGCPDDSQPARCL
jgi:hypothetical protein